MDHRVKLSKEISNAPLLNLLAKVLVRRMSD
jgi:hypothetical protein